MFVFVIEIITSIILGVAVIAFSCWLLKIKKKGVFGILLNAIMGCLFLFAFNLFGIMAVPINPLNAFICAVFGIFGVVLIYLIITFL
ncbi:MAG TPA: pro-sigmaK processing inhibitor BofA [Clostridiales bacterium]|nr:pro-sigmaK processing inhibitor BofA [Clostridiales bacterium]